MNVKIERIHKDIEKTKDKISEFQARLRELEKQKTELENTEIVDVVRGMDISITDLAALLKTAHAASGHFVQKPEAGKTIEPDKEETEK